MTREFRHPQSLKSLTRDWEAGATPWTNPSAYRPANDDAPIQRNRIARQQRIIGVSCIILSALSVVYMIGQLIRAAVS